MQIRDLSALKDLDHEVGIDNLPDDLCTLLEFKKGKRRRQKKKDYSKALQLG